MKTFSKSIIRTFVICAVALLLGGGTFLHFQTSNAQTSGPNITNVTVTRNAAGVVRANVTGSGFVRNGSEVYINGVPASKTKALKNGLAADGSPTRLRATDSRLEAIGSSGDQAFFQVVNTGADRNSNLFVLNPNAKPVLTAIRNAAGKAGTTVETVIEGRNLFGGIVTFSGNGLSTFIASTTLFPTRLAVTISIAADAEPGPRTVTVTTPAGTAQNDTLRFVVTGPDDIKPVVSNVEPKSGAQGATVNAVLTGFRLNGATQVAFNGAGVTASIRSGGTETSLPISITIAPNAQTGPRSVTVTTPGGVSAGNIVFTVEAGQQQPQVKLTRFAEIPDKTPDIYHMTEVPDGSYAVCQYSTRSLVLLRNDGSINQIQRNSFLLVSSIAFYSRDVAYTTCVPTILASRSFRSSDFGAEGIAPGNLGGVSNPRYMLGVDGLISRTFFLSNGGTGEIRFIDPDTRTTGKVVAGGFSTSGTDPNTRGLEQLAYDKSSRTIFAVDSSAKAVFAVDETNGAKRVLRDGFSYPFGLVRMSNGNLLVSDRGTGNLVELTTDGRLVGTYDTQQGADALRGLFVNSKGEIFLLVDKIQTIFRVSFN